MKFLLGALRTRLALLFSVAVAGVVALAVGSLALAGEHQFDASIDTGLATRAGVLTRAVAQHDPDQVRADPLAELLGADGRVLVSSPELDGLAGSAAHPTSVLLSRRDVQRAARADVSGEHRIRALHGHVRFAAAPLGGAAAGDVLVVGSRLDEIYDFEGRLLLLFLAGAPVLVLSLGVAGWLLAGAALRPVADLTARAAQISVADVDQRLPQPPGSDEVAALARTLNGMLGRVAAGVRREREFVDDAAHELRTPIAVLRGELELALRQPDVSEDVRESLQHALEEADRLGRLAQDLLVLATQERARRHEPVPLLALARTEVARLARVHDVDLRVQGHEGVVDGDPRALGRLLANLVANADAAGARHVVVRVEPAGDQVVLTVDDDGPGFPPALLTTALDRFTRGDAARTRGSSGAGLGLAIVAAVARAHGGSVALAQNGSLPGATVRVRLPAAPPVASPTALTAAVPVALPVGERG